MNRLPIQDKIELATLRRSLEESREGVARNNLLWVGLGLIATMLIFLAGLWVCVAFGFLSSLAS